MNSEKLYRQLSTALAEYGSEPICAQTDPENWFPEYNTAKSVEIKVAKQMCQSCPVKKQCADYAIAVPEMAGIWGGTTWTERQGLRKKLYGETRGRSVR